MRKFGDSRSGLLIALIVLQFICVLLFLLDGMQDANEMGRDFLNSWHFAIEGGAALALLGAIAVETRYLLIMFRSNARLERSVSIASGALQEVIADHFRTWGLTPAEQDVATFTIKGCSINDIAQLRGSSPGTVKSQLNAIYRKAGVVGRSGLLAVLIEDLLDDPLIPESSAAA
jgi:DNA-binding CsgD family transcriptional regulator